VGFAKVEVNGKTGILFLIKPGLGQGDLLSAILYIIAPVPCNRALVKLTEKYLFKSSLGVRINMKLFLWG